jgi:4-hydroxybenzoate polyprenyltransferase
MFGVIVMNSLEDLFEDRAAGMATPFVRYGIRRTAVVALVAYVIGAGMATALSWRILPHSALTALLCACAAASHTWVASMIATASRLEPAAIEGVRNAGRRNAMQFALVGMNFGAASILMLLLNEPGGS